MSDKSEYVIVRSTTPRYLSRGRGWTADADDAKTFHRFGHAVDGIAACISLVGYPYGLTIHRVVREPARVEEVPLREALNEGLPLVAKYGEAAYALPLVGVTAEIEQAERFATVRDILIDRGPDDIVGVREVPGKVTTVEVS